MISNKKLLHIEAAFYWKSILVRSLETFALLFEFFAVRPVQPDTSHLTASSRKCSPESCAHRSSW